MKKIFTLLLLACFVAALNVNADEIKYKSLGTGYMTDDMVTDLLNYEAVTYEVEILQAEDGSPLYRVVAPYGKAFADAVAAVQNVQFTEAQYDSKGEKFIDIDATNPDDVIFHKTMTGVDLDGESEIFIGINKSYNATIKDGIITAPILGIAVGIGNSAIAANRRGRFRIALPGVALPDFELAIATDSHCVTEPKFNASVTAGDGIAKLRYLVINDMQEDEMIETVRAIANRGPQLVDTDNFSYDMTTNKSTMIVVALDAADKIVNYDWKTIYFIDENPDGWVDCGEAKFTDGILQVMISNIPSQTTVTRLERSVDNPSRYRLVNPYSGLKEYAALNRGHEDHNHYIYINAEDLDCIYIEESPIGMESSEYGLMRVSSGPYYYLGAGIDLEEIKELEMGAVITDNVMTFPEEALMFSMLKYDNGDWYISDADGLTKIELPEGFSFSGVSETLADELEAPTVYYNLQGMRVENPQPGTVYVKVKGSHAEKVVLH